MSVIVLVPFDLNTIDSSQEGNLIQSLINVGNSNLKTPSRVKDTAALVLGKLLTRPDVNSYLNIYVNETVK